MPNRLSDLDTEHREVRSEGPPRVSDVVFYHVVFAFAVTSVQVSPRGWKKHV